MPDNLRAAFLDLLHELEDSEIDLMLGGGYGLFLKQEHLAKKGTLTLIPPDSWPEARATNDIDLLLRPEIVTRAEHMKTIRDGLNRLGFEVIKGAEFYQFVKRLGGSRYVKVDFLAGPLGQYEDPSRVKVDSRRVKPKPSVGLHAHRSDEAVAYELEPITVSLTGALSSGEEALCFQGQKRRRREGIRSASRPGSLPNRGHALRAGVHKCSNVVDEVSGR